jgi:hypothetical protein
MKLGGDRIDQEGPVVDMDLDDRARCFIAVVRDTGIEYPHRNGADAVLDEVEQSHYLSICEVGREGHVPGNAMKVGAGQRGQRLRSFAYSLEDFLAQQGRARRCARIHIVTLTVILWEIGD